MEALQDSFWWTATISAFAGLLLGGLAASVCQRITARAREATVARERDFIHMMVENMPGLFGVVTVEGRLVHWNRNLERLTGQRAKDLEGARAIDLFPADQRGKLQNALRRTLREGHGSLELSLTDPEGNRVPYGIACHLVTLYGSQYLVGFGYDLSARKALETEREQLTEIIEAAPDFVGIADPQGRILYHNPAARRLLGSAEGEEWWAWDSHPPEEARRLAREALPHAAEHGSWEGETRFLRPDGTEVPMAQTILAHHDESGQVAWFSTIARDLTKHKEAEGLARRHLNELAHASRLSTAGEMATQLAHELNQPLAAISANSQACLNYFDHPEPDLDRIRAILQDLQDQSRRAGRIIRQLRSFVGRGQSRWQEMDLNVVVENVLSLARLETEGRGIQLQNVPAPGLPRLHGDPSLVEQVAMNLVRNAAEAVSEQAARGEKALILVTIEAQEEGEALISVHDNGPGLSGTELDRVFEPFFTSKPHGMGLGLRISQSIVETHGGKLWAETNSWAGATFRFTLPRDTPSPPA
ncbi:MAG: PAS domain S-box protein [Thiohalorhabdus sp.]|uniref:PAS domain-containing sensor histidine kinase n=1 Tax=Thiohalorhabdus sp. TaxID=3094134 RepID=UPI0039810332